MFWAILSGVEGNLPAYNAVLNDIKRQQVAVNELYILGDLIGPRPDSEALVQQMRQNTQRRAQICVGWWEEQLFNLYGWGSDPDATQLKERYGGAAVEQLWNAVSRDTVQRLRSLDFGFFELDCLLIHGSTVGCDDTLTPETSPMTMLDRLLRSDANTLFCGRSGLAFQYQLPAAQVTSTTQTLAATQGAAITATLPKQHTLNARQVIGVGNVGRVPGHASYTLYNPAIPNSRLRTLETLDFSFDSNRHQSRWTGLTGWNPANSSLIQAECTSVSWNLELLFIILIPMLFSSSRSPTGRLSMLIHYLAEKDSPVTRHKARYRCCNRRMLKE